MRQMSYFIYKLTGAVQYGAREKFLVKRKRISFISQWNRLHGKNAMATNKKPGKYISIGLAMNWEGLRENPAIYYLESYYNPSLTVSI